MNSTEVVYPLVQTTALRVIPVDGPKPSTPSDFRQFRTLVRVKTSSKFYGLIANVKDEVGEIIAADPIPEREGWAYVKFSPSGAKNFYRIGLPNIQNGACDLELDERELDKHVVITYGGQFCELPTAGFDIEPGDTIKLGQNPLRVCGVEKARLSGAIAFVAQKLDDETVVVDLPGGRRTVSVGRFTGNQLEESGRVVLDASQSVIVQNLGLEDGSFSVSDAEMVMWDQVFGQDDARYRIQEALDGPARWPELYKRFKKKTPSGFLLFGPPGCGKTLLAKATYSAYAQACKEKGIPIASGFILVSGPELLSKYVGVAEAAIRHIFACARKFYKKYGIPAFIFIDECEAIAADRNSGISSDILKTIVPAFLAEMNGIRRAGCIVMMATNKPESLDPAFREGRIDLFIEVARPNRESAGKIFASNLKDIPVSRTTTLEKLVSTAVENLYSDKYVLYTITKSDNTKVVFTLAQVVNGAMIVSGIVEEAKQLALERNKSVTPDKFVGICEDDIIAAIKKVHVSNLSRNHAEALGDFTKSFQDQIVAVEKQKVIQT